MSESEDTRGGGCLACLAGFFGAIRRFLSRVFLPPVNADTVLEDYVPLVRRTRIIFLILLAFTTALNAAGVLYSIKMLTKTFKPFLPNVNDTITNSRYWLQFYIAIAIWLIGPIAFFLVTFWPLLMATRSSESIEKVDDHFTKRRKIKGTEGGGSDTPLARSPTNRDPDPGNISSTEETVLLHYKRYNIGLGRKVLFAVALFGALMAAELCAIALGGAFPWGGTGVVFELKLNADVKQLYDRAGGAYQLHHTFAQVFCVIAATPLTAVGFWVITLGAIIIGIIVPVIKELRRQKATLLISTSIFFATGLLAFLIYETIVHGGAPKPLHGRRLCFKNSCGGLIRVGQVGAATGLPCSGGCPSGTVCNPGNQLCHFSLKLDNVFLGPGGSECVDFSYAPVNAKIYPKTGGVVRALTQWSGSIYASTFCNVGSGQCKTAVCPGCAVYQGPVGPVTQAELTMLVGDKDFYDVTIINGANIPLQVVPVSAPGDRFRPNKDANEAPYYCGVPGSPQSPVGRSSDASWQFKVPGSNYSMVTGGSGMPCSSNAQCPLGETCGTAMMLNSVGKPLSTVSSNVCGQLAGMWSDDELCSWTDAVAYGDCKNPVAQQSSGTIQNMFQCTGSFDVSCFQPNSGSQCCGCTTWPELGIPSAMNCKGNNPAWDANAIPRLRFLKQACPTCYTYPYDDATSLFMCRGNQTTNENSYTIEWCPSGRTTTVTEP